MFASALCVPTYGCPSPVPACPDTYPCLSVHLYVRDQHYCSNKRCSSVSNSVYALVANGVGRIVLISTYNVGTRHLLGPFAPAWCARAGIASLEFDLKGNRSIHAGVNYRHNPCITMQPCCRPSLTMWPLRCRFPDRARWCCACPSVDVAGWYDGSEWYKPPDIRARDEMLNNYEVKPALDRLKA